MEEQDILDFANMVFSMEYGSIDFEELYPKAYSRECCHIPVHHTIEENGKIKALLDVYPVTLKLNGSKKSIRAAYIGTVAVHPKSRGKGYMTELMKRAENDAIEKGFDLMLVDGDRHRYRSYGFERAGIKYNFDVHLHHAWRRCGELYTEAELRVPKYSFEELDEKSEYLLFLYELYRKRNVTTRTKEDFFPCLRSNLAVTFAVLVDGSPAGYINLSGDGKNILEFELEDSAFIPRMLYDFMEGLELNQLGISVGADETEKVGRLEGMCDYCNMTTSHQMKLLRPEKVLEFLTAWKKKYNMSVINDDRIKALWRELEADDMEKLSLLTTCRCFMEMQKGENNRLKSVPADWLPLPFFLPDGDAF